MNFTSQIVGALVEAWGEVKAQKARVILSLVGVVAAVAALSVVWALGDLTVQSFEEMNEKTMGRPTTLRFTAQKAAGGDSAADEAGGAGGAEMPGQEASSDPAGGQGDAGANPNGDGSGQDDKAEQGSAEDQAAAGASQADSPQSARAAALEKIQDPVGKAMKTVAQRYEIPYWARQSTGALGLKEIDELRKSGTYNGQPMPPPGFMGYMDPELSAVDPEYSTLFRTVPLKGRWLNDADSDQRIVPTVINSVMWQYIGQPDFEANPVLLHSSGDDETVYRVVGVLKASIYEQPKLHITWESWQFIRPAGEQTSSTLMVWVNDEQLPDAQKNVARALASSLGPDWTANGISTADFGSIGDQMNSFRMIIGAIGAIVIFLGALGMLNVAIVTVRQRVSEIGIRRAMGASAARISFAVFMESVVATFVAGLLGVGLAVVWLQYIDLDAFGITLQEAPAFPMSAALTGMAISLTVGALCGIIPAVAAIRIRPIEAIRY
ncbi:MAG: ABC transporter permease [Actinomycetaceae bacterium]|nr:ABC transporter permease [Actinomycetaceae bacterium]